MDATQENMDANQANTDANQARMNVELREMKEEIKSCQAEIKSLLSVIEKKIDPAVHSMRARRKYMMACKDTTEACLECKEPTSEKMDSGAEHREVV
jgi:hypothetical protein